MRNPFIAISLIVVFVLGGIGCFAWYGYQKYKESPAYRLQEELRQISSSTISDFNHVGPRVFFKDEKVVALCNAIEKPDYQIVRRLVNEGVDINARGKYGITPMLWAFALARITRDDLSLVARTKDKSRLHEEHEKRIEALLKLGADPNMQLEEDVPKEILPFWPFQKGVSVTYLSAYRSFSGNAEGDKPLLPLVLQYGGNPNIVFVAQKKTPIFNVVAPFEGYCHAGCVAYDGLPHFSCLLALLIEAGANIESRDGSGATPILRAADRKYYDMVYMLLEVGADHECKSHQGKGLNDYLVATKCNYKKRSEFITSEHSEATRKYMDPYYLRVINWLEEKGYPLCPELDNIEEFLDKLVEETPLEYKDYDPFPEQWVGERKAAAVP